MGTKSSKAKPDWMVVKKKKYSFCHYSKFAQLAYWNIVREVCCSTICLALSSLFQKKNKVSINKNNMVIK